MSLSVRALKPRAVEVPMKRPLHTAGGAVSLAPLVLLQLETNEGITGCSYVFCYTPIALRSVVKLIEGLDSLLKGDVVAPHDIEAKLQRTFRLLGPQGLTGIAMAAVDMAAWDAVAKAAGLPLARLLGGSLRPIPAYNSCGLGIMGAQKAAPEAVELADGFSAIKVRLGYAGVAADVEVMRAVRAAVGDAVHLMTDHNQCLSVPEAVERVRRLDDEGAYWIEEPTRADDYAGHAEIRAAARTPVQLGENWWGPNDMAKSLAAGASDYVMMDASKIGGVTGWLRGAGQAHAHGLPVSSHLYPEISAHLLAVTPGCHWLEYVDWAEPILREPLKIVDGAAAATDQPGCGIEFDEQAVARYGLS